MTLPYTGEIRMFAGSFAPQGWSLCDGQSLSASEYADLFRLIGTRYGGDGRETFNLPDLRGRLPIHFGLPGTPLGQQGGTEQESLSVEHLSEHSHSVRVSSAVASSSSPAGQLVAEPPGADLYVEEEPTAPLDATSVLAVGGSEPHDNMQPYLCVNFIISIFGAYPSES